VTAIPEGNKGRLDSPTYEKNTSPAPMRMCLPCAAGEHESCYRDDICNGCAICNTLREPNDHYVPKEDLR
jgi:hypothetical protein